MKTYRTTIAASAGLLAVLLAVGVLTACTKPHDYGGGPTTACGGFSVFLQGTLSGLVGTGLVLRNGGSPGPALSGPASNGTAVTLAYSACNSAYSVAVQTQPNTPSQTCVVENGSGTAGALGSVTNLVVTCTTTPPRFAYVVNGGSNSVSAYTVDASTGALTEISGSPYSVGHLPVAIAVDPMGAHAFVANQTDGTISAFAINRNSGALTAVNGSPFATGPSPTSLAIDPTTPTLYVTNGAAGSVSVYSIAALGGALTAAAGSPFTVGASPSSVVVSPTGITVFVTSESAATITQYAAYFNGTLAYFNAPAATGAGPRAMAFDGSSQYGYVANAAANTLSGFTNFDLSDGPTTIGGSPYATGTAPTSVAVDLLHNFVYVADQGSADISAFALDPASGELAPLSGSPFAAGAQPSSVAIDPTDKFAYVVNTESGTVSVYSIDATTGALTPISGSPFVTGTSPSAIAISD